MTQKKEKGKNLISARFKTFGQTNMGSYNKSIMLSVLYVVKLSCAVRQVYKDTIKLNITRRRKVKP